MKDKYIGKIGTTNRDDYEYELRMDVLGKMIKTARQERNLIQEELGRLVGAQKAQISKLGSSANSATIDTIIKVFKALKAEIYFNVKLENYFDKKAERTTRHISNGEVCRLLSAVFLFMFLPRLTMTRFETDTTHMPTLPCKCKKHRYQ